MVPGDLRGSFVPRRLGEASVTEERVDTSKILCKQNLNIDNTLTVKKKALALAADQMNG